MIPIGTLRDWVLDNASDTSKDSILLELEAGAVAHVEALTGRYFGEPAERTEYPTIHGHDLYLNELPIVTVATPITLASWNGEEWEDIATEDFILYPISARDGARIHYPTGWSYGTRVRVTYTAGYEEGDEPAQIRSAVLYLVSERWNARGKEGLQSESVGGYQYTMASAITDRGIVADLLAPWKRPVVA